MTLWRLSNYLSLDGQGGLLASARWHTQGRRVVYLASSPASALLEIMVHLEVSEAVMPGGYQLLKIAAPANVSRLRIDAKALTKGWTDSHATSRRIGDRWLSEGRSALLSVPSLLRISWSRRFPYDRRLFRAPA